MRSHLDTLRAPLRRCARGELPANVALAQLLMLAGDALEVQDAIAEAIEEERREAHAEALNRLLCVLAFWTETPNFFATVKYALQATRGPQSPAEWARAFDRAAQRFPAAGVALYSLGRADLLRAATDEIIAAMRSWDLIAPGHAALDVGCGTGRITTALAQELKLAIGVDVSPAMLDAARRSGAGFDNAHFIKTSGRGLGAFRDSTFDLVCAVDSFPYLFISGLADLHVRDAARVLRPGANLVVLNYSYRADKDADRADILRLARELGLTVRRNGTRDFEFWDGISFLLQKPKERNGT